MSTEALESPRRLVRQDVTAGFRSGATELDDWFQRYAWQNQKASNAVVYVTAQDGVILGYYAITTATYSRDEQARKTLSLGGRCTAYARPARAGRSCSLGAL